jgi:hypothetical protein
MRSHSSSDEINLSMTTESIGFMNVDSPLEVKPSSDEKSSNPLHLQTQLELVKEKNDDDEPPNGGQEAWLTVVAGFCVYVNTWYGPTYLQSKNSTHIQILQGRHEHMGCLPVLLSK